MKVAIVVDKTGSAIDRLAKMTAKSANWHEYKIVDCHPKRPSQQQLENFEQAYRWCDIIDFRYWKTAEMIRSQFEIKKPCLLTHYNPYDINRQDWSKYNINITVNAEQQSTMKYPNQLVPIPIDLDYWDYQEGREQSQYDIIMVSSRIEGKKGVLPVAKVAGAENLRMLLVGSISDPAYYQECAQAAGANFVFKDNIPDDELKTLYKQSKIHICNSVDAYESGTMPILEAMSSGTPVITRRIGHVPDLFNGRNMLVRKSAPEDVSELITMVKTLLNDQKAQVEIAREARASLRSRSLEIYAKKYSLLYHDVRGTKDLVSVIVPTVAGPADLAKTLAHILAQNEPDMEVIVCDDSENSKANKALIAEIRKETKHTVKFYATATYAMDENDLPYKTYGLARARNKAILEAEGKWLMFVDDRLHVQPDAINSFKQRMRDNVWLWGVKDGTPKGFVENFSFVKRADLIRIGGFNEQISQYGGMTQEIRTRAELNKIQLEMVESATATASTKSRSRWTKYSAIAKSKAQCYKLYG